VQPERLVFAPRAPLAEHLARHRQADLFLDTLPYNAHTTASDALRAGLPVLTCLGSTFAGRVAASLLHAVGMPELIAPSVADYEQMALRLSADGTRALKEKLARNLPASTLFDSERTCRAIEAAFLEMLRDKLGR
jgi:predicted O-linked N-acetylglucosamine transferase (SPINDLY family)